MREGKHLYRNPSPLGRPLTPRELDALVALAATGSRKDAARRLGLRECSVRNHLNHVYAKLGVQRAIEAYVALGWLTVPEQHWRAAA